MYRGLSAPRSRPGEQCRVAETKREARGERRTLAVSPRFSLVSRRSLPHFLPHRDKCKTIPLAPFNASYNTMRHSEQLAVLT